MLAGPWGPGAGSRNWPVRPWMCTISPRSCISTDGGTRCCKRLRSAIWPSASSVTLRGGGAASRAPLSGGRAAGGRSTTYALQAPRVHVGGDALGEHAQAGLLDGLRVEVGGEDLHAVELAQAVHALAEQDGQRVGLLAGRAARHPRPQHVVVALVGDEVGDH